jgi:DNA-binding beta-propeller fold protein YncE
VKRRYSVLVLLTLSAIAIILGVHRANGGAFSRTLILKGYPVALAVDSDTSRAFVIDGANYALDIVDTTTGDLIGSTPIGTGASAIVVVNGTNRVFVPNSGDGTVSVLNARTGGPARTVRLGFTPALATVNLRTSRVYITDNSGTKLAILNGGSGAIMRRINLSAVPTAITVNSAMNEILIATVDNDLRAYDGTTGTLLRRSKLPGYPVAVAVDTVTNREFVVDPNDSAVIVLDGRTGKVLRTTRVTEDAITAVSLANIGLVAVVSRAAIPGLNGINALDFLDASTGRLRSVLKIGEAPNDMIAGIGPDILVDGGASLLDYDALDGTLLRTLPLRGARFTAQGFAIDERSGRVFVVSSDASNLDSPPAFLTWARQWLPLVPRPVQSQNGGVNEYGIGGSQ